MAGVTYPTYTTQNFPNWVGDYLDRERIVPGGTRVDAAQWTADATGKKYIPSGTPIGRTLAERDANTPFGPAAATDDEIFLLVFDITDAATNPDAELLRNMAIVKENFLPAGIVAGVMTALRSRYQMVRGVN